MPHPPLRIPTRRRLRAAAGAAILIGAGLIVHVGVRGRIGDIVGDALYAALIYLLAVVILPRMSRTTLAAIAMLFCFAVEYLQLTDLPRDAARVFPPARLVLGSGFDLRDLLVYAAAVLVAMTVDVVLLRARRRRR